MRTLTLPTSGNDDPAAKHLAPNATSPLDGADDPARSTLAPTGADARRQLGCAWRFALDGKLQVQAVPDRDGMLTSIIVDSHGILPLWLSQMLQPEAFVSAPGSTSVHLPRNHKRPGPRRGAQVALPLSIELAHALQAYLACVDELREHHHRVVTSAMFVRAMDRGLGPWAVEPSCVTDFRARQLDMVGAVHTLARPIHDEARDLDRTLESDLNKLVKHVLDVCRVTRQAKEVAESELFNPTLTLEECFELVEPLWNRIGEALLRDLRDLIKLVRAARADLQAFAEDLD